MKGIARDGGHPEGAPKSKGVLAPEGESGPFHLDRYWPSATHTGLVRHYWVPRWRIPDGESITQNVLEYPSGNLVVEPTGAALYGAHRGRSRRVLTGSGWGFGVLLQPGAARRLLGSSMRAITGSSVGLDKLAVTGGLQMADDIRTAIEDSDAAVVTAFESWLSALDLPADAAAALVKEVVDTAESDREITRVEQLADRFGLGMRRLQRLVVEYVGFSPKWLIQRYRLQEAAYALRPSGSVDMASLADLATRLGYADQAHFTRDFALVIGVPPGEYRRAGI